MLWIVLAVIAASMVVGIGAWCAAGVTILLRRTVYPKRVTAQLLPEMAALGCEEVRFRSAGDDALLSGWFVPAQSAPVQGVVLCCHGMSQNRVQMLPWAQSLWNG